jgi:hypothetical protein
MSGQPTVVNPLDRGRMQLYIPATTLVVVFVLLVAALGTRSIAPSPQHSGGRTWTSNTLGVEIDLWMAARLFDLSPSLLLEVGFPEWFESSQAGSYFVDVWGSEPDMVRAIRSSSLTGGMVKSRLFGRVVDSAGQLADNSNRSDNSAGHLAGQFLGHLDLILALEVAAIFLLLLRRTERSLEQRWSRAPVAILLGWAATLLPRDRRSDFVEEQFANVKACESGREQVLYLLDLVLEMPLTAWVSHRERWRSAAR